MTQRNLRETVTVVTGLSRKQVDVYFNVIADVMTNVLASGDRVDLLRFGSLKIKNFQKWSGNLSAPEISFVLSKAFQELMSITSSESLRSKEDIEEDEEISQEQNEEPNQTTESE